MIGCLFELDWSGIIRQSHSELPLTLPGIAATPAGAFAGQTNSVFLTIRSSYLDLVLLNQVRYRII